MNFPTIDSEAITRALITAGKVTRSMLTTHKFDADFTAAEKAKEQDASPIRKS